MRFATEKLVAQMFREERLFCLFVHHFQLQPVLIGRLFQGTKIKLACVLASVFVPDFIPDFRHIVNEVGILEAVFDATFPLQKQANPQGKWQVLLGQLKWPCMFQKRMLASTYYVAELSVRKSPRIALLSIWKAPAIHLFFHCQV